jgi:CBS domain-containing protein
MICPACSWENLPGADECVQCLASLMQEDVPQPETPLVHSIMTEPVSVLAQDVRATVSPDATVADAVREMQEKRVGYALVCDGDGRLRGILTERDLLMKVAGLTRNLESLPVSEVMTRDPSTCDPDEPVKDALFLMAQNDFRHVPLVSDGDRPQGVVTVRHFVEYLQRHLTA